MLKRLGKFSRLACGEYVGLIAIDCDPSHIRGGRRALNSLRGISSISGHAAWANLPGSSLEGVTNMKFLMGNKKNDRRGSGWRYAIYTLGLVALIIAAMAFYQVRELIAALVIFSVLFGALGATLLMLFFVQDATLKGVTQLEARMAYVRTRHGAPTQAHDDHTAWNPLWK